MLNRAAIILKYKEPAVRWINEADPHPDDLGISVESVNKDRTVYLIADGAAETPQDVRLWIELNFDVLFEQELIGWYTDDSLWPKKRDLKLFDAWFEVECHSILIDTCQEPIVDEKI